MMNRLYALLVCLIGVAAHAAPNLAVVSTAGSTPGVCSPRALSTQVTYKKPLPDSLVRVLESAATPERVNSFCPISLLSPADKIEVCEEVAEGTVSGEWGAPCTNWPRIAVSDVPKATSAPPVTGKNVLPLIWDAPMTNTDGTVLGNLAGFVIYYGPTLESINQSVPIAGAGVASYTLGGLPAGTVSVAITAVNATGQESKRSNTLSANSRPPPPAAPSAPTNLMVPSSTAAYELYKVSSTKRTEMRVVGTVAGNVTSLQSVVTDPTGTYVQVSVSRTTFKATTGTSVPLAVYLKQ